MFAKEVIITGEVKCKTSLSLGEELALSIYEIGLRSCYGGENITDEEMQKYKERYKKHFDK